MISDDIKLILETSKSKSKSKPGFFARNGKDLLALGALGLIVGAKTASAIYRSDQSNNTFN